MLNPKRRYAVLEWAKSFGIQADVVTLNALALVAANGATSANVSFQQIYEVTSALGFRV